MVKNYQEIRKKRLNKSKQQKDITMPLDMRYLQYHGFQIIFRNIDEDRIDFAKNKKQLNYPHACCIHSPLLPMREKRNATPDK